MSELDTAVDPPPVDTTTPPANDPPPVETAADTTQPAASSDPPEPVKDEGKASWPDDWRERLAGDDEAFLRHLKRYSSPTTFAKGFKEREDLIRSGKLKRDMPEASDEKAMAEWRKEQGIPDDPSGYVLPETVTKRLVDADKPMLANFTEFAHANSLPPLFVEKGAEWYATLSEQVAEKQAADDTAASEACEDALRKDWAHGEYKANLSLGKRFMEGIPGIGPAWTEARLPDGRRLGDIPDFVAWAADMGRDRFGDVTFASGDAERRHTARKEELETLMREDFSKYLNIGGDKEYLEIITREQKRARK